MTAAFLKDLHLMPVNEIIAYHQSDFKPTELLNLIAGERDLTLGEWGTQPPAIKYARLLAEYYCKYLLENRHQWVICDTETTGLEVTEDEAVEISIINGYGHTLLSASFPPICKRLTLDTVKYNHILLGWLQGLPQYSYYHDVIADIFNSHLVLFYNAEYDTRIIANSVRYHGLRMPQYSYDCLMLVYAQYVGEMRDGEFKWQKLPGTKHNALDDCRAAYAIIHEMAGRELPTHEDILSWYELDDIFGVPKKQ